jgi:uncharacterized protein (DUF169 family)
MKTLGLQSLTKLDLARPPVALAFLDNPPVGLARIDRPAPAGCGYWKLASEGQSFYTTADDHQNCPVGAFTHGVALPPAKAEELQSLVGTMIELQYLRSDEVAGIPHRDQAMQVAAYAPIEQATFAPDVVIFRGNVRQIMLLSEAARAGARLRGRRRWDGRPAQCCRMRSPPAPVSRASAASATGSTPVWVTMSCI